MRTLQVSRATARFINQGHPWVRPDRFTRGLDALITGEAVTLITEDGKRLASALIDRDAPVCASVYDRRPDQPFDPARAIAEAWSRRSQLHDSDTDCYRVVHGEADGLPGLRVERYATVLVVMMRSECARPAIDPVCRFLAQQSPQATIVIREHREDMRRAAPTSRAWDGKTLDPEAVIEGRELGVRVLVQPFKGLATGIYVDQRATRAWLRPFAAGKSVLNLFAYTGLFSVSLLAAGARRAIDVDLSAPALQRATLNAQLNGMADRHEAVRGDCLEFAGRLKESFDVVIVDPPTSSQGGDGWVNRRDYPKLLALLMPRVASGGRLVACSNTLGTQQVDLGKTVRETAKQRGLKTSSENPPTYGEDIPQIPGFPEGRPFQLIAARF
jgi:23S rRNA (cytosine1962-C5)-methyltransferase